MNKVKEKKTFKEVMHEEQLDCISKLNTPEANREEVCDYAFFICRNKGVDYEMACYHCRFHSESCLDDIKKITEERKNERKV